MAKTVEDFDQPAVLLMISKLTLPRCAAKVAACLVVWGVNVVMSIPLLDNTARIQHLIEFVVAGEFGFLIVRIKASSSDWRISLVLLIYASRIDATHTRRLSLKKESRIVGYVLPTPDVFNLSLILIRYASDAFVILPIFIAGRWPNAKARSVTSFLVRSSRDSVSFQITSNFGF